MQKIISFSLLFLFAIISVSQTAADYYKQGGAKMKEKKYADAVKLYSKAIDKCKDSSSYFVARGYAYFLLDKYQQSLDDYGTAIYLKSNNWKAYYCRSIALQRVGMFEEAIKDNNMAIMLTSNDTIKKECYLDNGTNRSFMRDFEGAYNDYMKALSYDSLDPNVYNNLATVMDDLGKPEKTLEYCLKAYSLDSSQIGPLVNIGFLYTKQEKYKEAIYYFDWALKKKPDEALAYSNRSYAKLKLGDLDGALEDINKSLKLYPSNSYAYRNRALVYIEMKKNNKACDDLEKAKELGFTKMYGNEVVTLIALNCK